MEVNRSKFSLKRIIRPRMFRGGESSRGGLLERSAIKGRVTAILQNVKTGEKRTVVDVENLVTTVGLKTYGWAAVVGMETIVATATPNSDAAIDAHVWRSIVLGSAGNAPALSSVRSDITSEVAGSLLVIDSGYPKNFDDDTDNPLNGQYETMTYRKSYATGEANHAAIDRVALLPNSPAAGADLLMYATFTAFEKTSNDTLKFIVNHTLQNP